MSQEVLYYIEMGPGDTVTLHRGGKGGPVIATADPCHEKQGSSKIKCNDPECTISLEHIPRRMMGIFPPKTTFSIDDKKYYWKGYTDVFEEKGDKLTAQFTPKAAEGADPNTGHLLMTEGSDETTRGIIILSTVVMQGRSEARKRAVRPLKGESNDLGVRGVSCISKAIVSSILRHWKDMLSLKSAK